MAVPPKSVRKAAWEIVPLGNRKPVTSGICTDGSASLPEAERKPAMREIPKSETMPSIQEQVLYFEQMLRDTGCRLVAVTKTQPAAMLQEAYDAGCKRFGENRVQEMVEKQPLLPAGAQWHLIGHLQTNKVKYIAPFVYMIQSVDSFKLLEEIDGQAAKNRRVIDCLLQIHIAEEETKFGFSYAEAADLLQSQAVAKLANIRICGLMGIATFTENREQIRNELRGLKAFFEQMKRPNPPVNVEMRELSMGMSGDYAIAIEEGSTMIRVGSAIFGGRQ